MDETLSQLLQVGPGIAAGATGNGQGMQAFMEAFQRTSQALDQQERDKLLLTQQREDRQRGIDRQAQQDQIASEQRRRQHALQLPAVGQSLAEAGATSETPAGAEQAIDALYSIMAPDLGGVEQLGGVRDAAILQAGRTITARQKRQVAEFVDAALKTSFIADNPDADPEITNLPEHVQKVIGKPSAKLSELQQFAQLPVGKPQGKTRVPAAVGSFEDYVQRLHGDTATPDQILAARKAYQQSDDKPTVNVTLPGGVPTKVGDFAMKLQDDLARDSKPYLTMREAYQRVNATTPDAAGDLSLIFAYMKILDPNSVVREQEFANAQNAAGVPDRVRNLYNQVMQGTRLNPTQREQFKTQAKALFENAVKNQRQVRGTYGSRAKQLGVPENMVLDQADEFLSAPPVQQQPTAPSGPAVGERRKSPTGDLIEWDGKGWKIVRM